MEEARWGAVFPDTFVPVLMIRGKCLRLRAKPAHLVGHLPARYLKFDGKTRSENIEDMSSKPLKRKK